MNLSFSKSLIYIGLVFCFIALLSFLLYSIPATKLVIDNIEAQSFDVRQRVLDKWIKKTSIEDSNVAVIAIDDDSLDVLSKKSQICTSLLYFLNENFTHKNTNLLE